MTATTISGCAQQAKSEHPLERFGWRRPPHWLWVRSRRAYVVAMALKDIWLILTGRCTLHRAWQTGHDDGSRAEYIRTVINGGR